LGTGGSQLAAFADLEQRDISDIFDQYDLNDVTRGKMPTGQVSGRLVLALQDAAAIMQKPYLRHLESALEREGKVLVSIMLEYWTRPMWKRLIEDKEFLEIDPESAEGEQPDDERKEELKSLYAKALDRIAPIEETEGEDPISMLDLDITVLAGSSLPTHRMAKLEVAIDLYNGKIFDRQAALEFIDMPEAQKFSISKRMDKQEEKMALMNSAGGQL
jgi:hypothetical protein